MKARVFGSVCAVGAVVLATLMSSSLAGSPEAPAGTSAEAKAARYSLLLALFWPSVTVGAGLAMRRGQKSKAWKFLGGLLLSIAVLWLPAFLAAETAKAYREATDEMQRTSLGWIMHFWFSYFGVLVLGLVMIIPTHLMRGRSQAPAAGAPPENAPTASSIPTSGLAIASLVCGCLGFPMMGLFGIPGLILGIMALRSIKASDGKIGGRDLAVLGIVFSSVSILAYAALFLLVPPLMALLFNCTVRYLLPQAIG